MIVRKRYVLVTLLAYLCTVVPVGVVAQTVSSTYRIGSGDRIVIQVPKRPDLNRTVLVDPDGSIQLPLAGRVQVEGLTMAEAEAKILQALRDVYPSVTEVEVSAEASGKYQVYVIGAVEKPGKYGFKQPPGLWDAIREAGGPAGDAQMEMVRIVKDASRGGMSQVVNVRRALDSGSVESLPELEGGDTIIIPQVEENYQGADGVDVFGAVFKPGTYRLQERNSTIEAILKAGGTLPNAKMAKVSVVRQHATGTFETITVDIRRFLQQGDPLHNPLLKQGDTIYVPYQNPLWYSLKSDASIFLGTLTALLTIALLINQNNNN